MSFYNTKHESGDCVNGRRPFTQSTDKIEGVKRKHAYHGSEAPMICMCPFITITRQN